jgi:hypothetical protein
MHVPRPRSKAARHTLCASSPESNSAYVAPRHSSTPNTRRQGASKRFAMRAMAVSVSVPKPAAARVALRLSMSCFVRSEHAAGQSAAGRKSGAAGSSRRTACLKRSLKWSRASPVTTHTLQACVLRHDGDQRAASRISVMSSSLTGSSA